MDLPGPLVLERAASLVPDNLCTWVRDGYMRSPDISELKKRMKKRMKKSRNKANLSPVA
jgi:hypothetical protein